MVGEAEFRGLPHPRNLTPRAVDVDAVRDYGAAVGGEDWGGWECGAAGVVAQADGVGVLGVCAGMDWAGVCLREFVDEVCRSLVCEGNGVVGREGGGGEGGEGVYTYGCGLDVARFLNVEIKINDAEAEWCLG